MAKKTKASVAKAMEVANYEYKPTIEIDEKMYPKVKDLKIDQVVHLDLKVKITRISRDRWSPSKGLSVSGEIQNAKADTADEDSDD